MISVPWRGYDETRPVFRRFQSHIEFPSPGGDMLKQEPEVSEEEVKTISVPWRGYAETEN